MTVREIVLSTHGDELTDADVPAIALDHGDGVLKVEPGDAFINLELQVGSAAFEDGVVGWCAGVSGSGSEVSGPRLGIRMVAGRFESADVHDGGV